MTIQLTATQLEYVKERYELESDTPNYAGMY